MQLPEDATDPWIINNGSEHAGINWYIPKKVFGEEGFTWSEGAPLPPGTYQFLFMSKDVTEEQAKGVVERFNNPVTHYHGKFYDYSQKERTHTVADKLLDTATESFHSLLTSKSLTGNYAILKLKK